MTTSTPESVMRSYANNRGDKQKDKKRNSLINMSSTPLAMLESFMRGDRNNRRDRKRKKYRGTPYKHGYDPIMYARIGGDGRS